jgi:hypothetical protein
LGQTNTYGGFAFAGWCWADRSDEHQLALERLLCEMERQLCHEVAVWFQLMRWDSRLRRYIRDGAQRSGLGNLNIGGKAICHWSGGVFHE